MAGHQQSRGKTGHRTTMNIEGGNSLVDGIYEGKKNYNTNTFAAQGIGTSTLLQYGNTKNKTKILIIDSKCFKQREIARRQNKRETKDKVIFTFVFVYKKEDVAYDRYQDVA